MTAPALMAALAASPADRLRVLAARSRALELTGATAAELADARVLVGGEADLLGDPAAADEARRDGERVAELVERAAAPVGIAAASIVALAVRGALAWPPPRGEDARRRWAAALVGVEMGPRAA